MTGEPGDSSSVESGLLALLRPLVTQLVAEVIEARTPEPRSDRSPWLTVREAADYLRVSEGSVRQLIRRGTVPSYKLEGRRLIRRPDLDDVLLDKSNKAPAAQQRPGA